MAIQPPNKVNICSVSSPYLDFTSISEDLKKMLVAYAGKQQKSVQAAIYEVVSKMPPAIGARVVLRGNYPDDTALSLFISTLKHNKDAISPFYHALEGLKIAPPEGSKWSFAELMDYISVRKGAELPVVAVAAHSGPDKEVIQESELKMDELTLQFKQLSLEISNLEMKNRELKTTLDTQTYTYQQLHGQLQLLLNRIPPQEAAPKRDIEGILGDLKALLKKYASDRQLSIVALILQIVAKMPSPVQGKVRFISQNATPDDAIDFFLGNVLRHKAHNDLYHALEALNIQDPQWKFSDLADYIPNGQAEAPRINKSSQVKEAAFDPLSRDYPHQVPLAKYRKLMLENENRKLTEELRKLKGDLEAVTTQLQRWKEDKKW